MPNIAPATNKAFLAGIFSRDLEERESIYTCSFQVDPAKAAGEWAGVPGRNLGTPEALDANNYFAPSTVMPKDSGKGVKRRKEDFRRCYVIPLDDVEGESPLAPSYVIQTSPGSRQIGFKLARPATDVDLVSRLIAELVKTGRLSADAGGNNPVRWVRLPFGANTKAKYVEANGGVAPSTALVEWHPERAYTVEEIISAFALDADYIHGRSPRPSATRRVASAEAAADPVIAALKQAGLYKRALGFRKHDITCPWVVEHTGGVDHGTCYFEPDEEFPRGGFKCQHGHCAERHLRDLCTDLEIEEPLSADRTGRPIIFLQKGYRAGNITEVVAKLALNDDVFSRETMLVSPAKVRDVPRLQKDVEEKRRSADQTVIVTHTATTMLNTLARHFAFRTWSEKKAKWVEADPPLWLAEGLVSDPRSWGPIRSLVGVTDIPILLADGTLRQEPGYHAETATLYQPRDDIPPIPGACTRYQAGLALVRFMEWLSLYKFDDESHRSAILAVALASLVRHLLPVAPYLHVDAPQAGSGKSMIAECIGILALGTTPTTHGYPTNAEEMRKVITSSLMVGDRILVLDNAPDAHIIQDEALEKIVTAEEHGDRLLGTNVNAKIRNNVVIIGTGNNNTLAGALPRRAFQPRIAQDVERPEDRSFPFKPVDLVRRDRGQMVSDGLTILAAYIRAGRPGEEKLPTWGSFEEFNLIRGALVWLGLPDPAGARPRTRDGDENAGKEESIYLAIWRHARRTGKESFTTKDVMKGPESMALEELVQELDVRSLGNFLSTKRGQVRCGGLRVEQTGKLRAGSAVWKITGKPSAEALARHGLDAKGEPVEAEEEPDEGLKLLLA